MRRGYTKQMIGAVVLLVIASAAALVFILRSGDDDAPRISVSERQAPAQPDGAPDTEADPPTYINDNAPEIDPADEPDVADPRDEPDHRADIPPQETTPEPPPPGSDFANLTGRVVDENNQPVPNATIYALQGGEGVPGPAQFDLTVTADHDGAFTLNLNLPGDFDIPVPMVLAAHSGTATSNPHVLSDARKQTQPLQMVVRGVGTLIGSLVDDQGQPVPHGQMILRAAAAERAAGSSGVRSAVGLGGGSSQDGSASAGSDERFLGDVSGGSVRIDGVRAGSYQIDFRVPGMRMYGGGVRVGIRADQESDNTWEFTPSVTVTAVVTGPDGMPLRKRVTAFLVQDQETVHASHANPQPDGSVWFSDLPEGTYEIRIVVDGYEPHSALTQTTNNGDHLDIGHVTLRPQ
jgi:hypothetical protein